MKKLSLILVLGLLACNKPQEPICATDTAQGMWYRVDDTDYWLKVDGWYLEFYIPSHGQTQTFMKKECDKYSIGRDTFYMNVQDDTLYLRHVSVDQTYNTKWIK